MGDIEFIIEKVAEGSYIARAIGHSIFTEADDLEELNANIREAVDCHFGDQLNPRTNTH